MNILAVSSGTTKINVDTSMYVVAFIVILLAILGIIAILSEVLGKKKGRDRPTQEKNHTVSDEDSADRITIDHNDPNVIMAHDLIQKLVDKGLESLLLGDNFKLRSSFYDLNLGDMEMLKGQLSEAMSEIFSYLAIPLGVRLSIVYVTGALKNDNRAGSYSGKGAFQRQIEVEIEQQYNSDNVLAILCHECTHYFMEFNNLVDDKYSYYNELMTDTLANLIGFGDIMIRGYEKNVSTHRTVDNRIITNTLKIGYLDSEECEVILNVRRLEQSHIKELVSQREKSKISKKEKQLKALAESIEAIMPDKSYFQSISTKSQQSYELMRSIVTEYKELEIVDEVQKAKNLLENQHKGVQVEQAILRLQKIYAKLMEWRESGYIK